MADVEGKKMNLEEAFAELDGVIRQLEDKDISLEESFQAYKNGMELIRTCNETISRVEQEVLLLGEDGETDAF